MEVLTANANIHSSRHMCDDCELLCCRRIAHNTYTSVDDKYIVLHGSTLYAATEARSERERRMANSVEMRAKKNEIK